MGCIQDHSSVPQIQKKDQPQGNKPTSNISIPENMKQSNIPSDRSIARKSTLRDSPQRKIVPKNKPQSQTVQDFCEKIFQQYDKDNNGFLTLKELRMIMKENVMEDLTERELRECRKKVDDNSNNKIQLQEFIDLYKELLKNE